LVWCNQRSNKYHHSHFVASLFTSNQWIWRCFSGYIKPMTDGICCFSSYMKLMNMTVFFTSLVTWNQWLWRYLLLLWLHQTNDYDGICYFSGYIKSMTMTVFVTSSGYIKPMTMMVFLAFLVTSNQWLWRHLLLLWLHETNDYDVASLVTSNQWIWRYLTVIVIGLM
jgi:hypothetical protein